jgi:hypothetical protein
LKGVRRKSSRPAQFRVVLLSVALLLLPTTQSGRAADSEFERKTLVGLKSVEVLIEDLSADAKRIGLSESALRTDIELKLRPAGIMVVDRAEASQGYATLFINLNVVAGSEPWGFNMSFQLKQAARLIRDPSMAHLSVTTWSLATTGTVGSQRLAEVVRDTAKELADGFVNAYLAANPKE